jgi:hypothetical protein
MNQQQKLGPDVYSQRVWNKTHNIKTGAYKVPAISILAVSALAVSGGPSLPASLCSKGLP